MQEQSFCFNIKCNYSAEEILEKCPKCGTKMKTSKQIKNLGWLQLVCGIFLFGLMSIVIYKVAPTMLGRDDGVHSFSGTPQQATVFLGILGAVFLFGILAMISGILQIKTGQRNKKMTFLVLGLAAILFFAALIIKRKYGG